VANPTVPFTSKVGLAGGIMICAIAIKLTKSNVATIVNFLMSFELFFVKYKLFFSRVGKYLGDFELSYLE
jgi:hypothetical protein